MAGQGFFNLGPPPKLPSAPKRVGGVSLGCDKCPMQACKVSWGSDECQGAGKKGILVLGHMPELDDLDGGTLFSGPRGEFVEKELSRLGINMRRDCWVSLAVRCRKEKACANDHKVAAQNCAQYAARIVANLKPKAIICLGPEAIHAVVGTRATGRLSGIKPTQYIGTAIPDKELGAWVVSCTSMEMLDRSDRDPVPLAQFRAQLKTAIMLADTPMPTAPEWHETTMNAAKATELVKQALGASGLVAFDYETTGLKPHRQGHRIVCASLAWERDGKPFACGFPWFPKDEPFIEAWAELMETAQLVAHKLDFEASWTAFRAGYNNGPSPWPAWWGWDTCLGAHCLANERPTGLKFETFTRLGVLGYDDAADEYITGLKPDEKDKGANAFNRVDECRLSDLVEYCALDSLYTLWLAGKQQSEMTEMQMVGMRFFLGAAPEMAEVQSAGMNMSMEAMEAQWQALDKKLRAIEKEILAFPELKKHAKAEPFNPASGAHVKAVLGIDGADEEALSALGTSLAKKILELRKWEKMQGTYLAQFKREQVGGIVRPFFNLHKVATFRSSSDSPNFQNIPKRDKEAQKIVRSLIVPSPGNRIIEYDYKAVEVAVGACYHRDPKMLEYIEDPRNDMHRDAACDLFFRTPAQFKDPALAGLLKGERQGAKGGLVFPAFYGSTYDQMAPAMWEDMAPATRAHVQAQGIGTLYPQEWESLSRNDRYSFVKDTMRNPDTWVAHVANVERILWQERFKVYAAWKDSMYAQYKRDGFVDLYTGFRCYGPLKKTAATNYPIQGSAFHVLLWTMMQVAPRIRRATNGRSRIIGQIHDALVADVNPADEMALDALVQEWGTQRVRKHWPWIIVPLTIEKERSEVNGSWAVMKGAELCAA